jgi:hypothetical protein
MIQQGVSDAGPLPSTSGTGTTTAMDVGRVMDWLDARVAAIRSREEEEDEDEDKEKEKVGNSRPQATSTPAPRRKRATPPPAPAPVPAPVQPTPSQHRHHSHRSSSPTPGPSSSSPTFSSSTPTPRAPAPPLSLTPSVKAIRHRPSATLSLTTNETMTPNSMTYDSVSIGQKRRHALVTALDGSSPFSPSSLSSPSAFSAFSAPATPSGTVPGGAVRRRTRHLPRGGSALGPSVNPNISNLPNRPPENSPMSAQGQDTMDVEDDGGRERDRKRVARR